MAINSKRTIVVGGGVSGLATAVELVLRGQEVTVLDAHEPGHGATRGNTGWVVPALSGPIPAPGLLSQSLRWLLDPDSPLQIHPRSIGVLYPWLRECYRYSNEESHRDGRDAIARFVMHSVARFNQWQDLGIRMERYRSGVLFLTTSSGGLDHYEEDLTALSGVGLEQPIEMTPGDIREFVPGVRAGVRRGLLSPDQEHVRPESLVKGLVAWLVEHGVEIWSGTPVSSLIVRAGVVQGVDTEIGQHLGDSVVLATGADLPHLADSIGVHCPIVKGRGYSITIEEPVQMPAVPVYLSDARVAFSPYRSSARWAGMMEFGVLGTYIDPRRVLSMRAGISSFVSDWEDGRERRVWAGDRALTPDGLPLIGAIPDMPGVYVASGHGMLGVTLAPATGKLLADLIVDGISDISVPAFNPTRFEVRGGVSA